MEKDSLWSFVFAYSPLVFLPFGSTLLNAQGPFAGLRFFAGFLVVGALFLGAVLFIQQKPNQWLLLLILSFVVTIFIPLIIYVAQLELWHIRYMYVLVLAYIIGLISGLVLFKHKDKAQLWWPYIGYNASMCVIGIILLSFRASAS